MEPAQGSGGGSMSTLQGVRSLPFVHTGRRYYQSDGSVRLSYRLSKAVHYIKCMEGSIDRRVWRPGSPASAQGHVP